MAGCQERWCVVACWVIFSELWSIAARVRIIIQLVLVACQPQQAVTSNLLWPLKTRGAIRPIVL